MPASICSNGIDSKAANAGGEGVEEPLLPEGGDSSAPIRTSAAHEKQIIIHVPFTVEGFIQYIVQRWTAFLRES
jgi:hypothetical protein